ncbi:MAG TPA: carbamoyltransferase HypF, partial [Casimicrobiaceae bacterium]|nr:carbamoyltransferase HypF [Casimicrobiaceae bacterium]
MLAVAPSTDSVARRGVRVRGAVQGVGFRPFVYRLAHELALTGWVGNDGAGVIIEVQGAATEIDRFVQRLSADAPPLARVERVETHEQSPRPAAADFAIVESKGGLVTTSVPADAAVCEDCLRELFEPRDRRYRYAFINCTQCGPRYTITRALPYDRAQTSMSGFAQCPACLAEYTSPEHRRFHAEPNACPACGPRLALVDAAGQAFAGDPIAATLARLLAGEIVAVKGLGGFHLACNARDAGAVARLRSRKHREEKPFAVMIANAASARPWATCAAGERALLESPERPIVLLRKNPGADTALAGIAPGLGWLGVMLPYTPLQYLIFHEAAGRLTGTAWMREVSDLALVMTSANPGGEPLVTGNDEALARLAGIADAVLLHDRDIVARCDDSVVRLGATHAPQFIRRARGYTPRPVKLARAGPSILATGAYLKNTVCVTRGDEAFLSSHIGDLDNATTCEALLEGVDHLCAVLDVTPDAVAHDLHPDFFSTRFAASFAEEHGLPAVPVQHHHAHIAAVAAEHRYTAPLLGLALDGVGLGDDGAAWGGELLWVDGAKWRRLGHLGELKLPGGDRAAREPWRMAASALHRLGRGDEITARFASQSAAPAVAGMLERNLNCPATSSTGRLFDAAAGLLGMRAVMAFEGQAAMQLEGLADRHGAVAPAGQLFGIDDEGTLDLTPLIARIADERDAGYGAALFHAT